MKFLIDANLPPDLAVWLRASGHDAQHIRDALTSRTLDADVWIAAGAWDAIVVTKDWDYVTLAEREPIARVVLVRCGNLKLAEFRVWFAERAPSMMALLDLGERVIELR